MMMRKKSFVLYIICIVLLAYVIVCRYSLPAADFYALEVYPRISLVLSFISSLVPFSIQEFIVTVIIIIGLFLLTRIRKWGFKRFAKYELLLLLSTYVWFYISWANNYSRSSIFYRTETAPRSYNEAEFLAFVGDYVDSINAAWTSDTISDISEIEFVDGDKISFIETEMTKAMPENVLESAKANEFIEQDYIDSEQTRVYIGEWHTHPESIPTPSQVDICSIVDSFNTAKRVLPFLIMMIVGTESNYCSVYNGEGFIVMFGAK